MVSRLARIARWRAAIVGLSLAAACGRAASTVPEAIPAQSLAAAPGQTVVVVVNTGRVVIEASATGRLELSGHRPVAPAGDFSLVTTPEEIRLAASFGSGSGGSRTPPAIELRLGLPAGLPVRVETFDAAVDVHGYTGTLRVDSTAGAIVAQGLGGSAVLRSGRGDVTLSDSVGEFVVLGEHGVLSLSGVAGQVSASTIMGSIRWQGPVAGGDVSLETDHGPVDVLLTLPADVRVDAHTTSGDVTCQIPGAPIVPRACQGTLGAGAGRLGIRTVAGPIVVRAAP
jgi:hypothetical protein